MKVCFDIQPALAQRAGVGRYTRELAKRLIAQRGDDELQLFCFDFRGRTQHLPELMPFVTPFRMVPGRVVSASWRFLGWPPFDSMAGPSDVYHFPNFVIPPLRKGRAVVTIHDLSFMRFPECAEPANLRNLAGSIHDTVKRAHAIITDSAFCADEIAKLLRVDRSRVHPIPLGVDESFVPVPAEKADPILRRLGVTRPYLLTVGTIEPRKNIPFLVEIFESLRDFDGNLVIAGMAGWKYEPILARMRSSPRAGSIIWLEYASDADLPVLYSGASAFITASFYEGFGLPPLEAMACGTPVISSAGGSLAEIAGPGAALMNDFSLEAWTSELRSILQDSDRRSSLVERGLNHARSFSWDETARLTWRVYREAAA